MYWFFFRSCFITEFQMENGLLDVNLKLFTILNMILHIILWRPNHTSFDFNETTLIDFPESWLGLGLSYCCVIESLISILIQFSISFKSYVLAVLCTWSCHTEWWIVGLEKPLRSWSPAITQHYVQGSHPRMGTQPLPWESCSNV